MGFLQRIVGEPSTPKRSSNDYIDLSEYGGAPGGDGASTLIRVAELKKYDDLKQFTGTVYDGNMLIVDFKAIAGDDIQVRRMANDLRKLAQDVSGDLAGLSESLIMVTPTGIRVDRTKLKATS